MDKKKKKTNVRPEIIKLSEENIMENLHDFGFGSDFMDMTPKVHTHTHTSGNTES